MHYNSYLQFKKRVLSLNDLNNFIYLLLNSVDLSSLDAELSTALLAVKELIANADVSLDTVIEVINRTVAPLLFNDVDTSLSIDTEMDSLIIKEINPSVIENEVGVDCIVKLYKYIVVNAEIVDLNKIISTLSLQRCVAIPFSINEELSALDLGLEIGTVASLLIVPEEELTGDLKAVCEPNYLPIIRVVNTALLNGINSSIDTDSVDLIPLTDIPPMNYMVTVGAEFDGSAIYYKYVKEFKVSALLGACSISVSFDKYQKANMSSISQLSMSDIANKTMYSLTYE